MPRTRPRWVPGSSGDVIDLVRRTGPLTRAQIIELTGVSRATVAARIDHLDRCGLIVAATESATTGGRPATRLAFHDEVGLIAVADGGATGVLVAVTDLGGHLLAEEHLRLPIEAGPVAWLDAVTSCVDRLVAGLGDPDRDVWGLGLALPGPVDAVSGRVVRPPIMLGWDGFDVRGHLAGWRELPVVVENDVNVIAVGQHRYRHADVDNLLVLKVATGIGAGIISNGVLHRGAAGAAGDIGHVRLELDGGEEPVCRCGNRGCLEAYAAGWAMVQRLREAGRDVSVVEDVVALIVAGDPVAVDLARRAGAAIGVAVAQAVNILNPGLIVVCGQLAGAGDQLFAGVRESVYSRAATLASRDLVITRSQDDDVPLGVTGLTLLLADHLFSPGAVDAVFARLER